MEIRRPHDRKHRSENLFVGQPMLGADAGEDVRADVMPAGPLLQSGRNLAGQLQLPFARTEINVVANLRRRRGVDHRPDVRARLQRIADDQPARRFDQAGEKRVVGGLNHDRPAARRALLPAVAEGGMADGEDGLVEVGRFVDDDRVLPPISQITFFSDRCPRPCGRPSR